MKRLLLALLIAATAAGDTTMQIRNGVLQNNMDANNFSVIHLALPIDPNDAATKAYVDSHAGGPGGPGTSLTSLVLAVPTNLFNSPVTFNVSTSDVTGTMTLLGQPANTVFGNPQGNIQTPVFMSQSQGRSLLLINNVDNTSDLNKPVSTAQAAAMSAALAAFTGTSNIVTLGTITGSSAVWNGSIIDKAYLPTLDSIRAPTASVSLGSQKIINLADPSNATDATNKQYVDSVATAGPPHVAVAVATTANVALTAEQTIDGVTTSASRILVKNQTTATANGIYVSSSSGWSRATDADTGAEVSGNVFVSGGTVNGTTQWGVTTPQPITLGTTAINYTLTGASAAYTAGNGLSLTGNQFSAVGTAGRITVGTTIDIASTYIGQSSITTVGSGGTPVTNGTWNASIITGQYGGTGINNGTKTLTISPGTSATVSGTNSGDITLGAGSENYLSLSGQVLTANPVDLSGTNVTGTLGTGRFPALTGPVTTTAGSLGTSITASAVGTSQLATNAVTYGKVQTVAPAKLLGNPIKTGTPAPLVEIALGAGLDFSSGTLIATVTGAPSTAGMVKSTGGVTPTFAAADPKTDYYDAPGEGNLLANAGSNPTPAPWPTPSAAPLLKRVARESVPLTGTRYAFLPAAGSFPAGAVITYIDDQTTGNFGRVFRFVPGDTINKAGTNPGTSDVAPFIAGGTIPGGKSVSFETNGLASPNGNWTVLGPGTVDHVEDPVFADKRFVFDASLQAGNSAPGGQVIGRVIAGIGSSIVGPGISVTVSPTKSFNGDPGDPPNGVLRDIDDRGNVFKSLLRPYELLPSEDTIDPTIVASGHTVAPDDGNSLVDTVRIIANPTSGLGLSAPYNIFWPPASSYQAGSRVALIDASGTVNSTNTVTIKSNVGDNFSGSTSFTLDEPYGSKVLVSDGNTNWFVPVTKTSIQGFAVPQRIGNLNTFTIDGASSAVKHNAHLRLVAGPNTLAINNPYDGMSIELVLEQLSASNGSLNLPAVSKVGSTGAGVIVTSTGLGKLDRLRGTYDATAAAFLWDTLITDHTTAPAPGVPTALNTGTITSDTINLTWTASANVASYQILRADGLSAVFPTGFGVIGNKLAGSTTYADTTVGAGKDYTYTVTGCNSSGCSGPSTSKNASALSGAPSADLLEWHLNEGSANVVGSTGLGPAGNNNKAANWVNVSGTNNAFAAAQGMQPTGGQTLTPSPVGSTTWKYRILAWNATGTLHNGATDISISGVTGGPATLNSTNTNSIHWNTVSGASYYEIYRIQGGAIAAGGTVTGRVPALTTTQTGAGSYTVVDQGTLTDSAIVSGTANDVSKLTSWNWISNVAANVVYPTVTPASQVVSISFWAKSTFNPSPDATDQIISLTPGSGANASHRIQEITGGTKLQINMAGSTLNTTLAATVPTTTAGGATLNVNDNTNWYHIVVVLDNSISANVPSTLTTSTGTGDSIRVYYNGVQQPCTFTVNSRAGGPRAFTDDQFQVGIAASFQGNYDDIRLYSGAVTTARPLGGALTPSEITAIFGAGQK